MERESKLSVVGFIHHEKTQKRIKNSVPLIQELLMRIDRVDEGDSRERQESYDEYEFGLVHYTISHLFFLCKRRHIRYQISTPTVNDDG